MTSWLNVKLIKVQVGKAVNKWKRKYMKCQVDESAMWWNSELTKCLSSIKIAFHNLFNFDKTEKNILMQKAT